MSDGYTVSLIFGGGCLYPDIAARISIQLGNINQTEIRQSLSHTSWNWNARSSDETSLEGHFRGGQDLTRERDGTRCQINRL